MIKKYNIYKVFENSINNTELKQLYLKYNKMYFDNKLPLDIEVKFTNSVKSGGKAIAHHINGNITEINKILISKNISDYNVLCKTLLHEMVHVKLYVDNIIHDIDDKVHGRNFKKELDRLKTEFGLDIPTDMEDNQIITKNKFVDVVLKKSEDDKYSIIVFRNQVIANEMERFLSYFTSYKNNRDCEIYLLKTDDNYLSKFPTHNSIKNMKTFYVLPNEVAENILKQNLIYRVIK